MKEPTFGELLMDTLRDIARNTVPAGMLEDEEAEENERNERVTPAV